MAEIAPTGMLDEHASRNVDVAGPAEYQPTDDEKKAIKLVDTLFARAKAHRSQYDEKWLTWYSMFRGRQWDKQRPSYRHSEVINLIFRTIQSLVPIQVDARPTFTFLPTEPSDMEFAAILNQLSEADWQKKNWSEQLLEVVYDSNIYGTGLSKMVVREVMGKIEKIYESHDPFYSFPDPAARDTNKDCGYFIDAQPVDVRILKARYPDKKDFIKPDVQDLLRNAKGDSPSNKFKSPVDNRTLVEGSNPIDLGEKDKALLMTCWITADHPELLEEFEEVQKGDLESGNISYEQTRKYPNGRKIVKCNGVILEDGPIGYDDGEIPFQRYPNYLLPREFWGMSEIEQLEGPQKIFNKLVNFVLDVLTLMGNPIWKIHAGSGVDPENILNKPGLVMEWDGEPHQEPKREAGVQLQPYVISVIDKMGEWFDSVAGSQDITRGVQPAGVTAATAINTLQEAAQTRVRQKTRNMDCYLQNVGRQWLSRTMQFTSAPEVFRLTNNQGAAKFFKMHVEPYEKPVKGPDGNPVIGPDGKPQTVTVKRAVVQHYNENGMIDPQTGLSTYEIAGDFDVRVSTGSSLPFAKDEKERKLLAFFDRGLIDAEEVLKESDYPNYQAVTQRMQQAAMQKAQADAAAQGAPGGGAPAPAPAIA
jgi:hypothetical protein